MKNGQHHDILRPKIYTGQYILKITYFQSQTLFNSGKKVVSNLDFHKWRLTAKSYHWKSFWSI